MIGSKGINSDSHPTLPWFYPLTLNKETLRFTSTLHPVHSFISRSSLAFDWLFLGCWFFPARFFMPELPPQQKQPAKV